MPGEPNAPGDMPGDLPRGLRHLVVSKPADAYLAGAAARTLARAAGFDETAAEEISLCAVELAANMCLHAGGGILGLHEISHGTGKGVEIYSEDRGPGIPDVEASLADGSSERGGLGCGLGTVHRLMDKLEVLSPISLEGGTRVRCSRMVRPDATPQPHCPLDAGAATRPHPGFRCNGDAFVIKSWRHKLLAGVIDGLGHGQFASKAALSSRRYVESHFDLDLEALFQGVDRACRATRGVVMSLALFDWKRSRLSLAGVGNAEIRHRGPSEFSFVARRGYLGSGMRPVAVAHLDWTPEDVLVISSDGLHGKWAWEDHPGLAGRTARQAAQELLRDHARDNDDATVVVVKGHPRPTGNRATR